MITSTGVFIYQLFLALSLGVGEGTGILRLPYSKFRTSGGLNTRAGLFTAYFLPIVIYLTLYVQAGSPASLFHYLLLAAMVTHFAKRVLEVLFVHSYSRPTPIFALANIIIFYASVAAFAGYFQNRMVAPTHLSMLFWAGLAVFAIGELTNMYHHMLLARLRKDGSGEYMMPTGGLFRYVACPHYLGEIAAFIGLAMMANHLTTWGSALCVIANLGTRSNSTLTWYREKMSAPNGWHRLIPYLY